MATEKDKLLVEREHTLAELKRWRLELEAELDRKIDGGEDSVDAAADIYEREKTLAIVQTLENKLESIDRALQLAERGGYGVCELCGKPIDPARLEIMPTATTCVPCQARLEKSARRRPRPIFRIDDE
jgi:DnaK suppressor protein